MRYTQEDLEKMLAPRAVAGVCSEPLTGIASLELAKRGDISFLHNQRYATQVAKSRASLLLLPENFPASPPPDTAYLFFANPSLALGILCEIVEKTLEIPPPIGIHPTAVIARTAEVHDAASVGPFCVIEENVKIGPHTVVGAHCCIGPRCVLGKCVRLHSHVTLYRDCELADRVILHSGVVIGSDGYGYATEGGVHKKLAHIGRVVLEKDVEIGANSCIDRARFAETRIGAGTKIDNLVQVAHNVIVGENCLLVAQVGIAGSTQLGNYVVLAGQAGVSGHLRLGDGVQVAAQGGVAEDLDAGAVVRGTPAMPIGMANRYFVLRKHVPELFRRVEHVEKKIAAKDAGGVSGAF
ncbi:MAG: UDP-3-O-(3-hydroxymyristoyl)glucosamine N-acyltransferase [Puniceicoccales bacterium]|nr:UDP-3-O-(3-hydroxymyristoyl)glucosamine N-acyltransferase [Puniceicoccales bacterium]